MTSSVQRQLDLTNSIIIEIDLFSFENVVQKKSSDLRQENLNLYAISRCAT